MSDQQNWWQRLRWASWMVVGMLSGVLAMSSQAQPTTAPVTTATVRQMLGQKLMLDLRYYCTEPVAAGKCRTPLTSLPPELADLISQYDIGGVILFAENLEHNEQIITLNRQLQQAAARSALKHPLFIGIDQEGGRVARLPRQHSSAFSGNMAIGATYPKHGNHFAELTGRVIADELLALGINVNFAPTVDVNVNPDNPVINVRAFAEDPAVVAELGGAMTAAMQQRGVIAALKHFPGHGDTHIDSHLGLPRVAHSRQQIDQVDLLPFAKIINQHNPGMIMTAHIQYPALDSSTFTAKDGQQMIKPATLSRAILHDLLRQQLDYQGLIVTDALDMAGISHFFSPHDAVIATFAAGADIALMPVKLQSPAELADLAALLNALEQAVLAGQLERTELDASYQRISRLKQQYPLMPTGSAKTQLLAANKVLGSPAHRQAELALAQAAVTRISVAGMAEQASMPTLNGKQVLLIMPDNNKAAALSLALQQQSPQPLTISSISLLQQDLTEAADLLKRAEVVISGFITPMPSLAEIGGMDDISALGPLAARYQRQQQDFLSLLRQIKQQQKPHVYISLRAPYDAATYGPYADLALASYAYNSEDKAIAAGEPGATYTALARVLLGQVKPTGVLPVTLKPTSTAPAQQATAASQGSK
ncbi:glycoside hydrolase family 3 N-terminal domain-containing protein [Arsukibacterium sp. UBA3155]|uniref:glycoside hydrolase family 3 N-terminal domain-containing protein n=1 Tax=Arsukibacterium sp. UBA3155 TaxID=1946058 RepID=UPI0025C52B39|nr:glycoside hydrolase family 3 protein [Arsukibacterium sp. UBA3155]